MSPATLWVAGGKSMERWTVPLSVLEAAVGHSSRRQEKKKKKQNFWTDEVKVRTNWNPHLPLTA